MKTPSFHKGTNQLYHASDKQILFQLVTEDERENMFHSDLHAFKIQGGSNMTGTDLCVNKPHCAAAVRH